MIKHLFHTVAILLALTLGGIVQAQTAAEPPPAIKDLLAFEASLDRKTRDLTLRARNLTDNPVRVNLDALRSPRLTGYYDGQDEQRVVSQWEIRPERENRVVVLAPREQVEVKTSIREPFDRFVDDAEKTLSKNPRTRVYLEIAFSTALFADIEGDGEAGAILGPELDLGPVNTVDDD